MLPDFMAVEAELLDILQQIWRGFCLNLVKPLLANRVSVKNFF
jgi:hypothetical protein